MKTAPIFALMLAASTTLTTYAATTAGMGGARPLFVGEANARVRSSANLSETFRQRVTVVDTADRPVPEAIVECYRPNPRGSVADELELSQRLTTGSNGVVELQLARPSAMVVVRKSGLAVTWRRWSPNQNTDERLVLTPSGVLSGTVVDEGGTPVADAEVSISAAWTESLGTEGRRTYHYLLGPLARRCFSTRTGAEGRFRLEGFPTNAAAEFAVRTPNRVLPPPKRDHLGPDTLPFRAGQSDIKLALVAASVIEGKIVNSETGQPVEGAQLTLLTDRSGSPGVDPVSSAADGTFRFGGVAEGAYRVQAVVGTNAARSWVADSVPVTATAGETNREVRVTASQGGFLKVTVLANQDGHPLSNSMANAYRVEFHRAASTDSNGCVVLRLPAGRYQMSASKQGWRSAGESVSAEVQAGQTNQVEVKLDPPNLITGMVRDPAGAPVAGLVLKAFPEYRANLGEVKTDAQGHFEFEWTPRRSSSSMDKVAILARDLKRNLAVAEDLEDDTTTLDLRLAPGLIMAGQVEDPDGKPITNLNVTVYLWAGNSGSSFTTLAVTNAQGRFEVTGLPVNRRYSAGVSAQGYGSASTSIQEATTDTNRVELAPFVLKIADRPIAGQVVDAENKPVPNVYVHVSGQGQPNASVRTDDQGRFAFGAVCEGTVRLYANYQNSYGNTSAEAGDTNIVLTLGARSGGYQEMVRPPSLVHKPLPDLAALGFAFGTLPAGKPLLLCLFDFEQRPSRRCLRLLTEQHESLRQRGLAVAAVQATFTTADALKAWRQTQEVPFPVGCVTNLSAKTGWAVGLEKLPWPLPWLILTDAKRQVTAEGFDLDELDSKIKALPK